MWLLNVLPLLVPAVAATAPALPSYRADSALDLRMHSCDGETPAELRGYRIRNERLEVIDRFGQPLQVVKLASAWEFDGCSEGPASATAQFEVTSHPRDGSPAGKTVKFAAEGQDPQIVAGQDWDLLRATRHGCCGAEDGHSYLRPQDGALVAVAATDPVPLQVINRVDDGGGAQGSLWRWAFALGSTSIAFDHGAKENEGVIAELVLAGPDRDSIRYAVSLKPAASGEEAPGPWSIRTLRWTGAGLDEQGSTWWIDGAPPSPAQVSGMALELTLDCQCDAEPLTLTVPVQGDRLDAVKARGAGVRVRVR